jgi:hypothetical protein
LIQLSASKIKTYQDCPHRYLLQYVTRSKQYLAPITRFGMLAHKILEDFHRYCISNRDKFSDDLGRIKMKEIFSQRLSQYKEQYPSHISKLGYDGVDIFDLYFQEYIDYFISKKLYTQVLHPEKNISITAGNFHLRGKIDLHIEPNIIIDFKSGKHETSMDVLENSLQSKFYSLASEGSTHFSYVYIKRPLEIVSFAVDKTKGQLINEIVREAACIIGTKNYPKKYKYCDYCPYRFECRPDKYIRSDGADSVNLPDVDTI